VGAVRSAGIGFGLGFLVALQLGPMSLFLVRTVLRSGARAGLGVGAGIALTDLLYAAAGAAGAAPLVAVDAVRDALRLIGATVLLWLGVRSIRAAARPATEADREAAVSPYRAFRTAVAATAANPTTILSWVAVFTALPDDTQPVPLVLGVGIGSLTWFVLLTGGVAAVRQALSRRAIQVADLLAGLGLIAFAVALAWSTLS
jgi:threonine/homoserine/homoserine lactone efflux protein